MRSQQQNRSKTKNSPPKKPRRVPAGEQSQSLTPPLQLNQFDLGIANPATLVQLQHTLGNRAVTRMLGQSIQREDVDLLSPGQAIKAMSYYKMRESQYTVTIISQLQAALGLPETGIVDEAMVQAAARWQAAHPPLKVDGMIGPRTLPALIPGGLAEQAAIETYAAGARGVIEGEWSGKSKEERATALMAKVNERLAAANVPVVGQTIQDLGGDAGQFDFTVWNILLDDSVLSKETLTDAEAADMADTVYHEARHAEQWYRMAQMRAGQGRTAAQIATEMGIPARIAAAATGSPLAKGSMDALIADGWYQSVYGSGSAHRERVLGPTGTHAEYMNLPEESDAWRVGGAVTDAYIRLGEEDGGGG
jgi:hypothetical protein